MEIKSSKYFDVKKLKRVSNKKTHEMHHCFKYYTEKGYSVFEAVRVCMDVFPHSYSTEEIYICNDPQGHYSGIKFVDYRCGGFVIPEKWFLSSKENPCLKIVGTIKEAEKFIEQYFDESINKLKPIVKHY